MKQNGLIRHLFFSVYETFCLICSYASRTKNIRNTPIINENSSYVLLQQYAEEIQRLRSIINSSNRHMNSLSRSLILDDQHSIKTICDRQISSDISPLKLIIKNQSFLFNYFFLNII